MAWKRCPKCTVGLVSEGWWAWGSSRKIESCGSCDWTEDEGKPREQIDREIWERSGDVWDPDRKFWIVHPPKGPMPTPKAPIVIETAHSGKEDLAGALTAAVAAAGMTDRQPLPGLDGESLSDILFCLSAWTRAELERILEAL